MLKSINNTKQHNNRTMLKNTKSSEYERIQKNAKAFLSKKTKRQGYKHTAIQEYKRTTQK